MRCYINIDNGFDYRDYIFFLEDVFNTSFKIIGKEGHFIHLESNDHKSYLLIRGENYDVLNILKNLKIYEKSLILITCTAPAILYLSMLYNHRLTKNKQIYYPLNPGKNHFVPIYDGKEFGLKFDPCESEFLLARNIGKNNIYENLNKTFNSEKVKEIKRKVPKWLMNINHTEIRS